MLSDESKQEYFFFDMILSFNSSSFTLYVLLRPNHDLGISSSVLLSTQPGFPGSSTTDT